VVAVPVFAPDLVGVIAATLPVDDVLLARLQTQSVLPKTIELVGREPGGGWRVLAQGQSHVSLVAALGGSGPLPTKATLVTVDGREYLAQAVRLDHSRSSGEVAALLAYSVDEALQPYRAVATAWAGLLGFRPGRGGVRRDLDRAPGFAAGRAAGRVGAADRLGRLQRAARHPQRRRDSARLPVPSPA
jgi:hypothetical protein